MRLLSSLFVLVLFSAQGYCANPGKAVLSRITKEAASPALSGAQWAFAVRYADTGKPVLDFNSSKSLAPASILKLLVTGVSLDTLGADYKFRTAIYMDGAPKIANGVFHGNIAIVGGGDPTLGSPLAKGSMDIVQLYSTWIKAFQDKGIKRVEGDIVADDSIYEPPYIPGTWAWEDMGNYYGAQASGLAINDNSYRAVLQPGSNNGDATTFLRSEPEIPGLKFNNFIRTGPAGSGDNGYIFCAPGQNVAVLRGTVPSGVKEFALKGSIPDPAFFVAQSFSNYLRTGGIQVTGGPAMRSPKQSYVPANLITETFSPPLENIVFVTNKRSYNFYAEMLLRALAVKRKNAGTLYNGNAVILNFLKAHNVDTTGLKLVDGCGLSRFNMITAASMADFLSAMKKSKYFDAYDKSLVYPGDPDATGHIRRMGRGTDLEGALHIKSGSLNGVRAYAGYLKTKKGRLLSFASIVNNYSCSPDEVEKLHEELLLMLMAVK